MTALSDIVLDRVAAARSHSAVAPAPRVGPRMSLRRSTVLQIGLVVGCIAAAGAALAFGTPSARLLDDPALAALLRGMAAIKALLAVAAFALVAWRFRHPIGFCAAAVCIVATAAMVGASAAIGALSSIVPAAIAFHVGMVAIAIVGWRDDDVVRPRASAGAARRFASAGRTTRAR